MTITEVRDCIERIFAEKPAKAEAIKKGITDALNSEVQTLTEDLTRETKSISHPGSEEAPPSPVCLVDVPDGYYLLGRHPACTRALFDDSRIVSRVHCLIKKESGQSTVCDLGSPNGTFLNDVHLESFYFWVVGKNDKLRISVYPIVLY